MALTIEDIRKAAATVSTGIVHTPSVCSRLLSEICGARVHLKLENLQYTASFKERGALNKLNSLTAEQRKTGVIAMSAGNHAQGIAYHAQRLNIPATIVMPQTTPFIKVAHTEEYGARVILHGETLNDSAAHAHQLADREGLLFVHPFDDELIIAGQGTVALELLEDVPDLDVIVVPIGGGGLISGVAVAAKALNPAIKIIGVEVEGFASMKNAIAGAEVVDGGETIAEGIAVKAPGDVTRQLVEEYVDDFIVVNESSIEKAVQMLLEIEKTVAEGAGAAALAGIIHSPEKFEGKKVGLIVSGGNIDSRLLATILMRGLVRSGRIARLRISLSDAPGNLAKVATLFGECGANIIEISHQRLFQNLPVKMAELDVVVETKDDQQLEEVISHLESKGFKSRIVPGFA
ncbi:MAG: threonine ammonia-lyase [Rhodospirillales bacterium]|nr:threonine ammonia-lyase [Rhodospirillales bacterium]